MRSTRSVVFLTAVMMLAATPAMAHELHLFAVAHGKTIEGKLTSADGEPIAGAAIHVFAAPGKLLGQTKTDAKGIFTFECRYRCDHRLVADAGGGHGAEFTVRAAELPEDLRALGPTSAVPRERHDRSHEAGADHDVAHQLESLGRQIEQLRMDVDRYQRKTRLQDVIGGVGCIVGVVGLWCFLIGRRRTKDPVPPRSN